MTQLVVVLLTAAPVAAGAVCGARLGGRRLLGAALLLAACWLLAISTAVLGFQLGWYWPAGLITPILGGMVVAACGWRLCRAMNLPALAPKKFEKSNAGVDRALGSLLGTAGGLLGAVTLWLVAQFVTSLAAPSPDVDAAQASVSEDSQSLDWARALVSIADRGFVRHLPVAGQLGNELEAVAYILRTPIDRRQEFAQYKKWDALAELPSFKAIVNNSQLLDDLDRAGAGNLAALYRLQRHPQVIAFVEEEPLQTMISELRASTIAIELAQFDSEYK